jgi:hypothetical protein
LHERPALQNHACESTDLEALSGSAKDDGVCQFACALYVSTQLKECGAKVLPQTT